MGIIMSDCSTYVHINLITSKAENISILRFTSTLFLACGCDYYLDPMLSITGQGHFIIKMIFLLFVVKSCSVAFGQ